MRLLVLLPAGAGEVGAGDALDREHLSALDDHHAAGEIGFVRGEFGGEVSDAGGDEVVGDEVAEMVKPEERELGEDAALVGDAGGEDVVEGGDAVGGDEEKISAGKRVDVADFAASDEREGELGFAEGF